MRGFAYFNYIRFNGARFFTAVLLPYESGRFPTVIIRSPYVNLLADKSEEDILDKYLSDYQIWLERGYAVVIQHCRGKGKSSGEFVPYIYEHEDGRNFRKWIRKQAFYNGELYLLGGSYTASVHYAAAPFEGDIRGAVLEVQDTDRYRLWYRNGQMRKGHANWHFSLCKINSGHKKPHSVDCFSELPICGLSKRIFGASLDDFEQMLEAARPQNEFWNTRYGGADAKGATDNIPFPVLFTTGYNDYYVGGMFDMWNVMSDRSKSRCAMLVSPYNHGDNYDMERGLCFPYGRRREHFGETYKIDWFDSIRSGKSLPYGTGVITYYRSFENVWESDFCGIPTKDITVSLGKGEASFVYNPLDPTAFCSEGFFQDDVIPHDCVVTVYTEPFDRDMFIKGKMKAVLTVSSTCPDTSFYMSISIKKPKGDYRLRHDITSLSYQLGAYTANTAVELSFSFDEYAYLLKKGECLRIDIASTDNNTYVCHTNRSGPYHLQSGADVAVNTIYLDRSRLILPVEVR